MSEGLKNIFTVTSKVIKGVGMGRRLGFPTINLVYPEHIDFGTGVYLCEVELPDEAYFGVMHLGPRETFDNVETFEVFLLNFEGGDLYGVECKVDILKKLRDVKRFENSEKLVAQIEKDIEKAQKLLT
ncbi:hypothetical protein HOG48_03665 [Candidatus Peregrinibacteria bacterium]|jgi:riboflavin kinase / FMN adenylyltransferase|nr:hypothetical protein [Candidatus Peregrinibacteria bacterium]